MKTRRLSLLGRLGIRAASENGIFRGHEGVGRRTPFRRDDDAERVPDQVKVGRPMDS